jgi:ArsR family transcriptional regulator, arsenate/arsenite/antimonite-responsive transcriptional repressor
MQPTQLFKALSDVTRLRCLSLLISNKELCVCELTNALALPQPKVSHHLAALRKAGLVADRKDGLWIHYRINPDIPRWMLKVIRAAHEGTKEVEPFANDIAALASSPARPGEIYMPDSNQ